MVTPRSLQVPRLAQTHLLLWATMLLACNDPAPTATNPRAALSVSGGASGSGVPSQVRDEESAFAELARQAPSSAGFYFDVATGELIVRVRDSRDNELAIGAVDAMITGGRIGKRDGTSGRPSRRPQQADYTFAELAEWRDLAFDHALAEIPGVASLDLDEVRNRVAVGVDPGRYAAVREAVLTRMQTFGVGASAMVFDSAGPHVLDVALVPPASLLHQSNDPLGGGLLIDMFEAANSSGFCTLGFVGQRNGQLGFVTASHCTTDMYGMGGPPNFAHQRTPRVAGQEAVDPGGYVCGFFSDCRGADASFFSQAAGVPMTVGLILRTMNPNGGGLGAGNGSVNVDPVKPYFFVTAEENNDLYAGYEVHKMSYATGWTRGPVTQTCSDFYVSGNHLLRCAYEAYYVADGGDSGGPVFMYDYLSCPGENPPKCVKLLGTHTGREVSGPDDAFFSKVSRIKSDLGGTWNNLFSPNLAAPVQGGSISDGHPSLNWNNVSGATSYEVFSGYCGTWPNLQATVYGLSFVHTAVNVNSVVPTQPACGTPHISYRIVARAVANYSVPSNVIHYTVVPLFCLS